MYNTDEQDLHDKEIHQDPWRQGEMESKETLKKKQYIEEARCL